MKTHFRVNADVKLDRTMALAILDQALAASKQLDGTATVARLRPAAFVAIMKADPYSIITWERGKDFQYHPTYRGVFLDVTDQLHPSRLEKHLTPLGRRLLAVREQSNGEF